jgi:hypothetical protein
MRRLRQRRQMDRAAIIVATLILGAMAVLVIGVMAFAGK